MNDTIILSIIATIVFGTDATERAIASVDAPEAEQDMTLQRRS